MARTTLAALSALVACLQATPARAADPPERAPIEAPPASAPDTICSLHDDPAERADCARHCPAWPAADRCLLHLRFGRRGVALADALATRRGYDLLATASAA